jgi:alpha-tubulin suppressor-like RCC1 family protein
MGQLGHGDLKSSAIPRRIEYFVENSIEIVYISCGGCHSGAVARNGDLYMWGEAHWGQLGLPKEYQDPYQVLPAKCPILKENTNEKLVKISCGNIDFSIHTKRKEF